MSYEMFEWAFENMKLILESWHPISTWHRLASGFRYMLLQYHVLFFGLRSVARFTFGKGIEKLGGYPESTGICLRATGLWHPLLELHMQQAHVIETTWLFYTSRHSLMWASRGPTLFSRALIFHGLLTAGLERGIALMKLVDAVFPGRARDMDLSMVTAIARHSLSKTRERSIGR